MLPKIPTQQVKQLQHPLPVEKSANYNIDQKQGTRLIAAQSWNTNHNETISCLLPVDKSAESKTDQNCRTKINAAANLRAATLAQRPVATKGTNEEQTDSCVA